MLHLIDNALVYFRLTVKLTVVKPATLNKSTIIIEEKNIDNKRK